MPPLTDGEYNVRDSNEFGFLSQAPVLATHATDPPPISTTIRKCTSEFKKTHQVCDRPAFNPSHLCLTREIGYMAQRPAGV
jgi:hypothetical protein